MSNSESDSEIDHEESETQSETNDEEESDDDRIEDCKFCPTLPCPELKVVFTLMPENTSWTLKLRVYTVCGWNSYDMTIFLPLNHKKDYMPLAVKITKKLKHCSYINARFHLINHEKKQNGCYSKKIVVKSSFLEIQANIIYFLNQSKKPKLKEISMLTSEAPRDIDIKLFLLAFDNGGEANVRTESPPSSEWLKHVVKRFVEGQPIANGSLCWGEQSDLIDYEKLLEEFPLLYKGNLMSWQKGQALHLGFMYSYWHGCPTRNYYYFGRGEGQPVLRICTRPCLNTCESCGFSKPDFYFEWKIIGKVWSE